MTFQIPPAIKVWKSQSEIELWLRNEVILWVIFQANRCFEAPISSIFVFRNTMGKNQEIQPSSMSK